MSKTDGELDRVAVVLIALITHLSLLRGFRATIPEPDHISPAIRNTSRHRQHRQAMWQTLIRAGDHDTKQVNRYRGGVEVEHWIRV